MLKSNASWNLLIYDEWIARGRAFRDCLWAVSRLYEPIPSDTIFIAQDKHGRNILAVFPNGLKVAYGHEEAERYITNTTHNLQEYAQSQPPTVIEDCRHIHHEWQLISFQIVDKRIRDAYRMAFDLLSPGVMIYSTKNTGEELFPLRAILINSLTEKHVDSGDWKGGWAWLGIFGKFTGDDLCLSQLGIRVPMSVGSVVGIRGGLLKHFVAPWEGYRYSVVHFFKESLHQQPPKETKRIWARIDLKEGILDPSERAKRRRHIQNRRRTRAQEIRRMVAHNHAKPEDWHTTQE
ncbi:hypothetical protein GP486_004856 [Trichoglossum hirsutum]|uniref:Uncharacterized protein n=1 Tax=Trichoglossum hirsutum TaxID=265104 RepID=A0A9P8LAJ8_9PEZI|nr:hypothetical protein GP486_004856 [Trichoglossum hirsutum]